MNQTDLQGETERALRADILGAVARGWCSLENAAKVMDVDVANAITAELLPLFNAGISGAYAAAATRLDELADAQDALSENLSKRGKIEEAQECAEICEHLREAAISIRALTPADARGTPQDALNALQKSVTRIAEEVKNATFETSPHRSKEPEKS